MKTLITNISQLITLRGSRSYRRFNELSEISIIDDAALYIEDGIIKNFGREKEVVSSVRNKKDLFVIDAGNRVVMPGFVDCHTHSVFAKPRILDFQMRISGLSYAEIKKRGGGINASAKHIRDASFQQLCENLLKFLNYFIESGTIAVEIKSGYGLDFDNEIKILKTISHVKKKTDIDLISTFLGAHSIPEGISSDEYLSQIKQQMLPYIAKEKLADFVDIFCENGYFSSEQSFDYLNYAKKLGFGTRIHADQLSRSGGSVVAAMVEAKTADHVDWADEQDMKLLAEKGVGVVLLPASNYFLGIDRYPDARKFIEKGCAVILATDFNPGTSPCWNMQFVISLALIKMKMTVEQAITASTFNAAFSCNIADRCGMIDLGMQADIIVLDISDYRELGYYFGGNINWMTLKRGKIIYEKNKK